MGHKIEDVTVSVVIPCTDRVDGVLRCIKSALNQDYIGQLEILLIENNSKNKDIIKKLLVQINDLRIRHYYLESCSNANVARNFGSRMSNGKYIAYLDSDDCWLENHISKSIARLEQSSEVGGVYSGYLLDDGVSVKSILSRAIGVETGYSFLFGRNFGVAQTSSYVVKSSIFKKVSWDEELSRSQDYDFFITVQHQFGWCHKNDLTVRVCWELNTPRSRSTKSYLYFFNKHTCNMTDEQRARYLVEIIKAVASVSKSDFEVFSKLVGTSGRELNIVDRAVAGSYFCAVFHGLLRRLVNHYKLIKG